MTTLIACLLLHPGILQQPTLTATVSGNKITATWTIPPGRPSSDWIGVFPKGSATGFVDWVYISGSRTEGPVAGATAVFTVPAGEFDIRYIDSTSGSLYVPLASAAAVVGVVLPGDDPPPGDPLPPVAQTRRVTRVRIVRANGTVEIREPQENTNYSNPAQSALELVVPELGVGDEAFVDEWIELVVLPTRTPDRVWRVKVNSAIP